MKKDKSKVYGWLSAQNCGKSQQFLVEAAHDISTTEIFEAVRLEQISSRVGAEILSYKEKNKIPVVRHLTSIYKFLTDLI